MTLERTCGSWLTIWSCSEPGGHCARVAAMGPNSSWFGPADFHPPRARLQSMRALTIPSASKASVYLDPSSGVSTAPSPPWNFTRRHDVPPRLVFAVGGEGWAHATITLDRTSHTEIRMPASAQSTRAPEALTTRDHFAISD